MKYHVGCRVSPAPTIPNIRKSPRIFKEIPQNFLRKPPGISQKLLSYTPALPVYPDHYPHHTSVLPYSHVYLTPLPTRDSTPLHNPPQLQSNFPLFTFPSKRVLLCISFPTPTRYTVFNIIRSDKMTSQKSWGTM